MSRAYTQMDEIDGNGQLSREDKQHRRCEVAAQALAEFEASKRLVRARETVELAATKHKLEQHVLPEIALDTGAMLKALKEA